MWRAEVSCQGLSQVVEIDLANCAAQWTPGQTLGRMNDLCCDDGQEISSVEERVKTLTAGGRRIGSRRGASYDALARVWM